MRNTRKLFLAGLLALAVGACPALGAGDVEETGSIPIAAGTERPDGRNSSGADGASGHPLMTAAASVFRAQVSNA